MIKKQKVKNSIRDLLVVIVVCIAFSNTIAAQSATDSIKHNASDSVFISKIEISKNWISWEKIIKQELLFDEGEWVRYREIDSSMTQVWNIGNFADVNYTIEQSENGNIIHIIAHDAVVIYPVITIDYSSQNDYKYRLGIGDDNFLGSNTKLKVVWEKQPTGVGWDFSYAIPRQLLYKNLTLAFGFKTGEETRRFLERVVTETDGKKQAKYNTLMLAPYYKKEYMVEIGNPWQNDYKYRFSPNLGLAYFDHRINPDILSEEDQALGVTVPTERYKYLQITVSEDFGFIKKKRHRQDGYLMFISYSYDFGLSDAAKDFYTINLVGEHYKILNRFVQLTNWLRTGYTTATDQYQFIKGSSDVLGLRTGELYGQVFYSAYTGVNFTWFNTKWLSLENTYFLNFGNGAPDYSQLFTSIKLAVGTSLFVRVPMVSFIAFRFTVMYAGPGTEWFKFNM